MLTLTLTYADVLQKEAFARIAECETIQNMYREVFGENHDMDVLEGMNEVMSTPRAAYLTYAYVC
jgi:hypothetical protein